jgi:hypothetical protein
MRYDFNKCFLYAAYLLILPKTNPPPSPPFPQVSRPPPASRVYYLPSYLIDRKLLYRYHIISTISLYTIPISPLFRSSFIAHWTIEPVFATETCYLHFKIYTILHKPVKPFNHNQDSYLHLWTYTIYLRTYTI